MLVYRNRISPLFVHRLYDVEKFEELAIVKHRLYSVQDDDGHMGVHCVTIRTYFTVCADIECMILSYELIWSFKGILNRSVFQVIVQHFGSMYADF